MRIDVPGYYVRIRGVVSGPFDLGQLQTMRRLMQLSRFHEISPDGRTWFAASTIAAVFPAPAPAPDPVASRGASAPGSQGATETSPAPAAGPAAAAGTWYYADGEQAAGPIGLDVLQRLIARGEVGRDTLVWTEGMTTWLPYCDVATSAPERTVPPGEGAAHRA